MTWAARLERAWSRRGWLSNLLWPVAALFGIGAAGRRLAYRLGWLHVQALPMPVVVVGNLVAGGAGKTPTVIAIVALLQRHGFQPGIVSRGHGGDGRGVFEVTPELPAERCGDEPLLLRWRTGVPLVVGRDRPEAARHLLARHPAVDVIVSDDGLQHLALPRAAQVIVFDERGAGNGRLLPAGPLREPVPRAVPPRSLVLYNAGAASTRLPGHLAIRSIAGVVPLAGWWRGERPTAAALDALRGRPVAAAAGLGRPERFFRMLTECGLAVVPLALPDHFDYRTLPWRPGTADVIVTEKDAVKLKPDRVGTTTRVWVAPLDFALEPNFETALIALLCAAPRFDGNTPA